MRFHTSVGFGLLTSLTMPVLQAVAQTAPLEQMEVPVQMDSGFVFNSTATRATAFNTVVRIPDATWLRLQFDVAILGESPGAPTVLRITSRADGAVQNHTTLTLQQWSNTSAYFNGDAVEIEIIADPEAGASQLQISQILAGPPHLHGDRHQQRWRGGGEQRLERGDAGDGAGGADDRNRGGRCWPSDGELHAAGE